MEARKLGIQLDPEEMFEVLGDHDPTVHAEEVEQRWSDTDAYRQSHQRASTYSRADWQRMKAELDDLNRRLVEALQAGHTPDSSQAMSDVPNLRLFTTHEAPVGVLPQIRQLLEAAFDGDFSDDDWSHTLGGWHAVTCEGTAVLSHAAVVPRVLHVAGIPFATGYVEGVATAPDRQREGFASLVMRHLNVLLREEFELGALSTDRHEFYERHGWERWRGPTFVRRGATLVRTEDEDEGVMVLRFGSSVELDLTATISCDSRTGDDW